MSSGDPLNILRASIWLAAGLGGVAVGAATACTAAEQGDGLGCVPSEVDPSDPFAELCGGPPTVYVPNAEYVCVEAASDGSCDPCDVEAIAEQAIANNSWCSEAVDNLISVRPVCGPVRDDTGACCYYVDYRFDGSCAVPGRPWVVDDGVERPEILEAIGSASPAALALVEQARFEYASVAAFAQVTTELMALGAPARLVSAHVAAGADELEHARLRLMQAARLGFRVSLGPLRAPVSGRVDPIAFVRALVLEGCVNETLAASLLLDEVALDQHDREIRDAIAHDEARHAGLAFATLRWALEHFGEPAKFAAREAFTQAERHLQAPRRRATPIELRTYRDVIRPAVHALLRVS